MLLTITFEQLNFRQMPWARISAHYLWPRVHGPSPSRTFTRPRPGSKTLAGAAGVCVRHRGVRAFRPWRTPAPRPLMCLWHPGPGERTGGSTAVNVLSAPPSPCLLKPAILRPSGTLPGLAYSPALGRDQRNQPAQGGVHGVGVGEIGPDHFRWSPTFTHLKGGTGAASAG